MDLSIFESLEQPIWYQTNDDDSQLFCQLYPQHCKPSSDIELSVQLAQVSHFQLTSNHNQQDDRFQINWLEIVNNNEKKKNSNSIKKIGRLILENIDEYQLNNRVNIGIIEMMHSLCQKNGHKTTSKDQKDNFNTSHFNKLLDTADKFISKFNLIKTRRVLTTHLRNNILKSAQISKKNKLIYLKSLKCSTLRCMNKNLAIRLQLSQHQ